MPPKFAVGLRACCVAVALVCTPARAAERSPLLGATRQQVVDRLGEPKSAIVAGSREILFFNNERLVLRDGVVVEVENIAAEVAPRRPTPAETTPAPAAPPPAAATPPARETPASPAPATPAAAPAATPEPAPAPAAGGTPPADDGKLSIKSVRPQGASRTAPKQPAPAPQVAETPKPAPAPVAPPPAPRSSFKQKAVEEKPAPPPPTAEELAAAAEAAAKKERSKALRRKLDEANLDEPTEDLFSGTTYLMAAVIIGSGLGFLLWQRRQRQIALDATAVSRTPFTAPVSSGGGARFTADLLGKLEWKRFEDLVAAYYSKTGVVAARTKTGPASPVHIRISWKGEPRPFACVQCLAHPPGLIDQKRLQELVAVLAAEDIRRGYVVTTGKFSVGARDLAEEKHLTLLPGDIFLEKLNALPDAARAEIMQEIATGDYTTPSCPTCEAKMVRSPDDSSVWRCDTHRDQTIAT